MKKINNKEKIKRGPSVITFIAFVLVVIILGGCLSYNIYLHNQVSGMTEDMEKVTAEKELVEKQMEDVAEDLEIATENLDAAAQEIERQAAEIEKYKQAIEDEDAKWKKRYEEYPVATEAWIAMKAQGWSDIVCAGIMGNLMAETGGTGTLHLDWDSNGGNGYGLVQWIGGRRSTIKNRYGTYPSVKEQVQFINDELYGVNGVRRQVTDSQLNAIMEARTPEECAYAFACYYERCATGVRSMRRGFARDAYEYFLEG